VRVDIDGRTSGPGLYASGEVTPDGIEIGEAAFFDVEKLPNLPAGISISRRMIDAVSKKLARGEAI
jgi:NAD+ diphosphatase